MEISVVIPVYKNKELFLKNLEHNLPYFQDCEIIIVDDHSEENIKEEIQQKYQDINVLVNEKNLGFGPTVNRGIQSARGTFILLLNSDVLLQDTSYLKGIAHLKSHPDLFAISFMQTEKNGEKVGKNRLFFQKGMISHTRSSNLEAGNTAWAEAGSCLIRKDYFERLGGFDPLYAPFYWEDIDLSYRAYKHGWKVYFEPNIVVEHHHESTIGKYHPQNKIKTVAYRNQFIFIWKNITDESLIGSYLMWLPYYILVALKNRDKEFLRGFMQSLLLFPKILISRKQARLIHRVSDMSVLKQLRSL